MVTIWINNRSQSEEIRDFTYYHSATTWLLLAGFLPTSEDPDIFVNMYTRDVATVHRYK